MPTHRGFRSFLARDGTAFLKASSARDLARSDDEEFAAIVALIRHASLPSPCAVDDMDASVEEMAYALDVLRARWVSSATHVGGDYLGDPRFDTWFAEMAPACSTLFVHPVPSHGSDQIRFGRSRRDLESCSTRHGWLSKWCCRCKQRFAKVRMICTARGDDPYVASRDQHLGAHVRGRPRSAGIER